MTKQTEFPFHRVGDLVRQTASTKPDAPALSVGDQTLSWRNLVARAERVAASLQRDGVKPGESIAIISYTNTDYVALFLGALMAAVAVAPMPPSATPEQLRVMVADSGAPLLFLDEANRQALQDIEFTARVQMIEDLDSWLAEGPPAPIDIDDAQLLKMPFNIIYSSGTTGVPKGIIHSWAMRWMNILGGAASGYDGNTVNLLATPLYSNTTLVSALPALVWGGHLVMQPKFDALEFLQLAQKWRATHSMLVPVQYQRILDLPEYDDFDLSSYVMKFTTSAPLSAERKREILDRWPGGLIEYWGMTEGGAGTSLVAHEHPDKLHTVGRPFAGGVLVALREDGSIADAGEIGELAGHSNAMMTGYANRPDATKAAQWQHPDGRIFLKTGDLGRVDEDGFVELLGRSKDMIISGGFNIYAIDIEDIAIQHPDVKDVAVVAIPSARWGESPVAFIEASGADAEAIRLWVNERVGKVQRLAAVQLVDELPRSAIGKILKRELREAFTGEIP